MSKQELWTAALRGANMYQQDESRCALGGELFCPSIKQEDLTALKVSGANYVTFSVPGIYHVNRNGDGEYYLWEEMKSHLKNLVEMARVAELFVVISFRTGPARGEGDITNDGLCNRVVFNEEKAQKAWESMWQETAKMFHQKEHVIGYDIMCEPHNVKGHHIDCGWRNIAKRCIRAIRDIDPDTPVLVSVFDWGSVHALDRWVPLEEESAERFGFIVYNIHQYEPNGYAQENEENFDEDILKDAFKKIYDWKEKYDNKYPVVVNEYGVKLYTKDCKEGNEKPDTAKFIKMQHNLLKAYDLPHAIWLWQVDSNDDSCKGSSDVCFDFRRHSDVLNEVENHWNYNK